MKNQKLDLSTITNQEQTPLVKLLIQEILYLRERYQELKDEIAILKKGCPQR